MRWALIGLMILMLPGIALAQEEITVPAVEYDIGQWEQLWRGLPEDIKGLFGGLSPGGMMESYRENAQGTFDGEALKNAFKKSLAEAFGGMSAMIGAALIMGLTDIIIGNREGTGEMLHFCMTGLCITSITGAVCSLFGQTMEAVNSIAKVTEVTSPVMMTLIAACGSARTAASQPVTILLCNAITDTFKGLLMPLISIMCGFSAAASITGQDRLTTVAGLIKSMVKWSMGLAFTFFLGSVSIRGLNAYGLDRAGVRAIKYAFDKSVPVVGGMISGTYDGLLAGAVVLKNAAGTAAVLLLILTAVSPALTMLSTIFAIRITAALCGVLSDSRISGMLKGAAESCTYMFAVAATAALMNLISIMSTLIASGV